MIEFPFAVGILGWVSTVVFWIALVMIVYGIVKCLNK